MAATACCVLLQSSSVLGTIIYVSPTGSDSNNGSPSHPLATVAHALTLATAAGDSIQLDSGTYNVPSGYNSIQDGVYAAVNYLTHSNSGISIISNPTNTTRPVLNFSAINPSGYRVAAFWVPSGVSNVTFQGFDVVAVQENITNSNNQSVGMAFWGCTGCTCNEVNVHDADCVGFYLEEVSISNLWYRCDSYNNTGIDSYSYGNADGLGCHPAQGGVGNILRECRSWNNSDDGYDCINAAETVTFDHCWSYKNGNNGGNGNGFKVGGWGCSGGSMPGTIPVHIVQNCLSALNTGNGGYYANHQPGQAAYWTNNTAFDDATDFNMLEGNGDQSTNCSVSGTREVMHWNLAYEGTITANYNESGSIVSSNSWTESGVSPGSADFVSVDATQMTNARNADGSLPVITFMHLTSTGESALVNLGCFIVPPVPTDVNATAGSNQVVLSWGASAGAYGYNVYRSTSSGGPYTEIASVTTTSYTDTTAVNGTTYYYVITATNPGDESTYSSQVSATPTGGAPPTPTGLQATAGNDQVALVWNASTGATSYNVGRSTTSGGPYTTIASPTTTNYTDTTAVNGTTYYYVVAAVNGGGTSANSSQVSATPEPPIPPVPTGLQATAGNDQVALVWNASTGATSYNVGRSTTSGGPYTTIASPTTTNYTDTTAVNGTTYYYVVAAVNGGGTSANCSQVSATPSSSILPSPWVTTNIGAVGIPGSATYNNGLWTVTGSGANIYYASDTFFYVYQPSSGNCSIQADVLTVENSGTHAKGGVMIRETLGTNAIMADVDVTPSKGVEFIWRTSTGGNAASTNVASVTAPIWVQVTRTGSTFVGSYSTNGTAWIPMATNTFTMASNANIGLVVCAYNNATNCTATFTNVTVNP
ncbi:MAG: hypothetical protein ABSA47_11225 [Verrucomicrobiota bacterium]